MLIISLVLLSLVAVQMSKESFAAGYKPPTRTADMNYNVPKGTSLDEASHVTKPKSFDFSQGNWSQFSGGGPFGGKGPFG